MGDPIVQVSDGKLDNAEGEGKTLSTWDRAVPKLTPIVSAIARGAWPSLKGAPKVTPSSRKRVEHNISLSIIELQQPMLKNSRETTLYRRAGEFLMKALRRLAVHLNHHYL
jgi:hypothetical protein